MQRYRAIFRYAIFINLAVAALIFALSVHGILEYHEALERSMRRAELDPSVVVFGGFGMPEPQNSHLIFAWVLLVDAVILAAATIGSVRRSYAWVDWTRIFAVLAIWFVIWLNGLMLVAFHVDQGPPNGLSTWDIVRSSLACLVIPLLATLWLAYNLVYRSRFADAGPVKPAHASSSA